VPAPLELLRVWESGLEQPPASRALSMLGAACSDVEPEVLAELPVGHRDALLVQLRCLMFGADIAGVAACPECTVPVEAAFCLSDLVNLDEKRALQAAAGHHDLDLQTFRVRFRLPNSSDLLALVSTADAATARSVLLDRCILWADRYHEAVAVRELPDPVIAAITRAMAGADPCADLQLALQCPACGHRWETAFDVVRFLWQEIHVWARRTLREVDILARTYHWSEAQILSLQPRRRQAYLELCRS
jgi:hypothetical protein